MYKTNIVVTLEVEGIHNWPQAKDVEPDVDYLSNIHRHQFYIKAKKTVNHDDRDIEIILLKRSIKDYLLQKYGGFSFRDSLNGEKQAFMRADHDFGSMSCEMLAREIANVFGLEYCEVLEDGENGAEVIKEPIEFYDIVLVCGHTCSGKNTFIENNLSDYRKVVVSDVVKEILDSEGRDNQSTSQLNDTEDLDYKITNWLDKTIRQGGKIVIDGIRQPSILSRMLSSHKCQVVWLSVSPSELKRRYELRDRKQDDLSFEEVVEKNINLGLGQVHEWIINHENQDRVLIIKH